MLVERSGASPVVARDARLAPSAHVVGDVRLGSGCVIDHGAVIASAGPPIVIGAGTVVMANAVVRSVGGPLRPEFPLSIGNDSVIGPLASLVGCTVGDAVYIATGVMVFQGATVGLGSRLGAGSIIHVGAKLEPGSRVGMRCFAVVDDDRTRITGDLDEARELLARADFFGRAFGESEKNLEALHRSAAASLRAEADAWSDLRPEG